MRQNLGSNPQISCKMVMDVIMIMGFLYLMRNVFILTTGICFTTRTNFRL